jgi:ABC-type multidrug transport system ATPase subunit
MNENILKALMQLFALLVNPDEKKIISSNEREIVESYLKNILNKNLAEEYLKYFETYVTELYADFDFGDSKKVRKKTSLKAVKVLKICEQINLELTQVQKFIVLVQLIEFINSNEVVQDIELEFLQTVSDAFNIPESEFQNCLLLNKIEEYEKLSEHDFLIISDNNSAFDKNINNFEGKLFILNVKSCNLLFFKYIGHSELYLNNQLIKPKKIYLLDFGSSIRGAKINNIYYTDIASYFLSSKNENKINLIAHNVEFRFRNSSNGIHNFNFSEDSCKLVGIMGGSGVGKSTLINIFNGNIKPDKGEVYINGYNIHQEKDKVKGIIGFVPQDDLLIEELTVFQNLYYNAKLCFDQYDSEKIKEIVLKTLEELELLEIKDLKVGNFLNKYISGGQRKRLNIALELIREPTVLFVDEPTSGLSSMDSRMVMDLLKELTLKGKLIIVNIHQPSSDIYKMFDKLIILDKGGYMVYYGNPLDAVIYFKKKSNYINSDESSCEKCGNINPEQVLEIIEAKVVNEFGKLTKIRKVSPVEWNEKFVQENKIENIKYPPEKISLPESNFKTPNFLKQFLIFLKRDVLSKLTNKQYLLICLLEAPLLAFILGFFTKYISNDRYTFIDNENLPSFLFMSVVVALFLGLTIAAEEIIKDKKIRKREKFLNLNNGSYINAKVFVMFAISAIQTITFVLIGNFILDIKGMTLSYFLVLFTTACFSNMLGLLISSLLNSVVTIYILIPFILVPQILFTGVIVKFDKLHKSIASDEYVSVLGDIMISRWAYEALAVSQFRDNHFQKPIFDIESKMSKYSYFYSYLIPELQARLTDTYNEISVQSKKTEIQKNIRILNAEIEKLRKYNKNTSFNDFNTISVLNDSIYNRVYIYFNSMRDYFNMKYDAELKKRDKVLSDIDKAYSDKGGIKKIKEEYFNNSLDDLMRNKMEINKIVEKNGKLIPLLDPIFREPTSKYGRAHFYAPCKIIGNYSIYTFTFNLIVIWVATFIIYLLLLTGLLNKLPYFKFNY